jgi:hypothetical protein
MGFIAKLEITDLDSCEVYKISGKAEATLIKGFNYLREKDGRGSIQKAIQYVKDDVMILDSKIERMLYGKRPKP